MESALSLGRLGPMTDKDFHKKLEELVKKAGRPNFAIYGYQKANGEFEMNVAAHKVPLKTMLQGLLHVLQSIVDQTIK